MYVNEMLIYGYSASPEDVGCSLLISDGFNSNSPATDRGSLESTYNGMWRLVGPVVNKDLSLRDGIDAR